MAKRKPQPKDVVKIQRVPTRTRYFETSTGRSIHIVRENAWHGTTVPSLCGQVGFAVDVVSTRYYHKPLCKTCRRLGGLATEEDNG